MDQPVSDSPALDTELSRRGFLRASALGAALLGIAGAGASLSSCAIAPLGHQEVGGQSQPFRFLTEDDEALLLALAPALLAGALPADGATRAASLAVTVATIDEAIYRFSPANRAEFRKLFDLLNFGPTRALVAGVWRSWPYVDTAEADAFLNRWRDSRLGLLNNAYNALAKVTNVAFYGTPGNWPASGYPGPPAYALEALPQFRTARAPY